MMFDILSDITFHLLRPWWLLAILPALVFAWILFKRRTRTSGWAAVIDSELLAELLDNPQQSKPSWPVMALILAWLFAAFALAGPCFEKNNQVALKQADAWFQCADQCSDGIGVVRQGSDYVSASGIGNQSCIAFTALTQKIKNFVMCSLQSTRLNIL